jgi:hypothetical protein
VCVCVWGGGGGWTPKEQSWRVSGGWLFQCGAVWSFRGYWGGAGGGCFSSAHGLALGVCWGVHVFACQPPLEDAGSGLTAPAVQAAAQGRMHFSGPLSPCSPLAGCPGLRCRDLEGNRLCGSVPIGLLPMCYSTDSFSCPTGGACPPPPAFTSPPPPPGEWSLLWEGSHNSLIWHPCGSAVLPPASKPCGSLLLPLLLACRQRPHASPRPRRQLFLYCGHHCGLGGWGPR